MSKTHGYYEKAKKWCSKCKKSIGVKGWHRHEQSHQPGGAPYLGKRSYSARIETPQAKTLEFTVQPKEAEIPTAPAKSEVIQFEIPLWARDLATRLFPTDPLLWNALMLIMAAEITPESLRGAAGYLNYKAETLENNN